MGNRDSLLSLVIPGSVSIFKTCELWEGNA